MTDEAKTRVYQALSSDGPAGALEALRWSIEWAAQTVNAPGATAPIDVVIGLDDALTASARLLGEVPALVAAAQPGPDVEAYLDQQATRLRQAQEQVAKARTTLDELRANEDQLQQRAAQHEQLRQEINDLRRLERLVAALEDLRAHRDLIRDRVARLRDDVGGIEPELADGGRELLRLSRDRSAALAEPVRAVMAELDVVHGDLLAQESELHTTHDTLARMRDRQQLLTVERAERLVALHAHEQADRRILAALAAEPGAGQAGDGLAAVRAVLDQAAAQLEHADRALRDALDQRSAEYTQEHRIVGWSDAAV
ncbi:hypothetical protein Cs7R123_44840 [Catellatospora sp. TT07R-123]|uniref:hypothetical protein n=1 Tax=Catellatospora sp. TT07R-123 TaxID=2733863 RepID=UPI001B14A6B6|nr:hypothetical protein [Catellatospora sp. TT07R-123]GHJ47142.1 hypothetical protein Cs7R123_44840 [Catellatospora sp. TT07R-123]